MSTAGYTMGYLMVIAGIALCLLGIDQLSGEMAIAGTILISSTWFGFFVFNDRPGNE